MLFDPFLPYKSRSLSFGFAETRWELDAYYKLRARVFCQEQKIFKKTDIDKTDTLATHIVSTTDCMGMADQVVGAVRIHEAKPGVWFGSRLAVHADYRTLRNFQSQYLFNADKVVRPFTMSVGAALIFKAVTSAQTFGCTRFQANVQCQNVHFFERLYWKILGQHLLYGQLHYLMEANLACYPASEFTYQQLQTSA